MSKCAKNMFPSKLDLTKDECRGALRRLGLLTVEKFRMKKKFFSQKAKPKQKV